MADATRVIDAMTRQLAEAMKQLIISQVEVVELREQLEAIVAREEIRVEEQE